MIWNEETERNEEWVADYLSANLDTEGREARITLNHFNIVLNDLAGLKLATTPLDHNDPHQMPVFDG